MMEPSMVLPPDWQQALRHGRGVVAEIKVRAPHDSPQRFALLAEAAHKDSVRRDSFFFLESQGERPGDRRLSLIAGEPLFSFLARGQRAVWSAGGVTRDLALPPDQAFEVLGRTLAKAGIAEATPGLSPFLGWLSYEAGYCYENLKLPKSDPLGLPDWYLMLPGDWAWFDPDQDAWRFRLLLADSLFYLRFEDALGLGHSPESDYPLSRPEKILEQWEARCRRRLEKALREGGVGSAPPPLETPRSLEIRDDRTRDSFGGMVKKAKQYIAAGDVFQVNLSHRLSTPYQGRPWSLFRRLSQINPSPYAAFADLGPYQILSSSPERLFMQDGRKIETHPIAGTMPRQAAAEAEAAGFLRLSEKDRAEHVMTVDIERNDFSRVCEAGSVRVSRLMDLETYSHVIHLVSRVDGRLKEGFDLADLFRAAFPGGSITGAPKIRCMELIAELEGSRRGVYTGSLGYWDPLHQKADFNILIRTLLLGQGRAWWQVGAGIVADSDPDKEWEETLQKGAALKLALESAP
jgi:anthranilate/para-aminobenzoate synthase component I